MDSASSREQSHIEQEQVTCMEQSQATEAGLVTCSVQRDEMGPSQKDSLLPQPIRTIKTEATDCASYARLGSFSRVIREKEFTAS
jgi:hypothetical protein